MKLRPQRTNWPITAPNIIVIKFTMIAMVGKPPSHINMPPPAAYFETTFPHPEYAIRWLVLDSEWQALVNT